ncbi:hypothetical protein ACHAWU_010321 [Discostella pseudostelligera]|uniref:Uncharacterized protein n=1 Tax=Discostella pseudostelligera TaxID=259834 RepID=A0ABD3N139_9STRA
MNNNNINKPAESSQCRRLRRMNILQERKLGHHQWKHLKLKMMQHRKLRDNKRRQADKVQHRIARVQKSDRHWIEQYRDAQRHRNLRLNLSDEELQHVRMQDAQRHRTARANLTAEQRERLRQKNAFQHKMAYIPCQYFPGEKQRIVDRVIQYHNQQCKSLGHCSDQCNYREIYRYVSKEEQRRIREATGECGCRFRWNYSQEYSIIN